jgi:hypothetical protein
VIFHQEGGLEGTTAVPVAAAAPVAAVIIVLIPVLSILTTTAAPKHYLQHSLTQMCNAFKDTLEICVPRVLPILSDKERTVNIAKAAQT